MLTPLLLLLLSGWQTTGAAPAGAAQPAPTPTAVQLEISLEQKRGDGRAEPVAPGHVFAAGDVVRLKLKSHYNGYLYVLDQGTSGRFATVFPAAETGNDNRIRPSREYLVPAVSDGWFEVNGPEGFDVLYFLLSPSQLASPATQAFVAPGPVSSLKPRCNDQVFRARGECMDDSAGPAALAPDATLPAQLPPAAASASRDITFVQGGGSGPVTVAGPAAAPTIYTFRLAHR
jgi:hypothetical protein